jgi:hypothetical protein
MKALITLVLIFGIWFVGNKIYSEYDNKRKAEAKAKQQSESGLASDGLEGMNPAWEPSLQQARDQGAGALKIWLDRFRPHLRDPKLASIELDYVVLVTRQNPAEARRVFQGVKRRVPPGSPVYERVKKLEKTYGP